jgi:transcriptional regulator with XRE-family HTH domain
MKKKPSERVPVRLDDLGTTMTILRVICGMNQREVAEVADVTPGLISDCERGKLIPGLPILEKILRAEGYPLSKLQEAQGLIQGMRNQLVRRRGERRHE